MLRPMSEAGSITAEAAPPRSRKPLSFEDLFASEHLRLFRALTLVTGNRQEAEDVMQEAFIRLWEGWDRVGRLEDPVGYLYRAAMNLVRMRRRRARMAARKLFGPRSSGDPLLQVDERDRLDRALQELTVRQRTALVLVDLYRFTSEEAAHIMRASPVTVRRLAAKGRAKVRNALEEDDA
jgi:RNA polymerase sigma-70 factor, ECF subfamily